MHIGNPKKFTFKIIIGSLLLIPLVFFFYSIFAPRPVFQTEKPNVLLLFLCSFRRDRISSYGVYKRKLTPAIDRLAKDGVIFTKAISQSSWTKPSTASLLTSAYVSQHNVYEGFVEGDRLEYDILDSELETLPEAMNKNGYYTMGLFQSKHLRKKTGFDQGFSLFFDDLTQIIKSPKRYFLNSLADMSEEDRKKPFFAIVQFTYPHFTYSDTFLKKHYCNIYRFGNFYKVDSDKKVAKEIEDYYQQYGSLNEEETTKFNQLIAYYDSMVAFTDENIGDIIKKLKEYNLYNNTLVVVYADHGEEMMERGNFGRHGWSLYEELINIPLIIKFPHNEKVDMKVDSLVESIDIGPTILNYLHYEVPTIWQGRSLLPLLLNNQNRKKQPQRYAFSELIRPQNKMILRSIRDKRYKLIKNFIGNESQLYDLDVDPKETKNIISEKKDIANLLLLALENKFKMIKPIAKKTKKLESDKSIINELKSLGYVQ